jgi:RNA polymerase sigma-70 factor (ECF subfamily)
VLGQLTDGVLAVEQRPHDAQAGGIGQQLQQADGVLDVDVIDVVNCMRIHANRMLCASANRNRLAVVVSAARAAPDEDHGAGGDSDGDEPAGGDQTQWGLSSLSAGVVDGDGGVVVVAAAAEVVVTSTVPIAPASTSTVGVAPPSTERVVSVSTRSPSGPEDLDPGQIDRDPVVPPEAQEVPGFLSPPADPQDGAPVDDATAALLAAQDGDAAAFGRFVAVTRPDVRRFCAHLVDVDDVDHVIQDTYVRALRSLGGYRGDANGLAWVLTIARRASATRVRGRQRRRQQPTPQRRSYSPDHAADIEIVLLPDHLDADQRRAFVLTQLLGLPYQDTATICDCPVGTVRSRVARARQTLADLIELAEREA